MFQHIESIFNLDLIDTMINNITWKECEWGKTGRKLPRLVQSMDISTLLNLVPELAEITTFIQENYGNISSVWMNLYRLGTDYCPYHRDSYNCTVVTLSIGGIPENFVSRIQTEKKLNSNSRMEIYLSSIKNSITNTNTQL